MNRNPTPRHSEQILLRSNPVARQEAHSSQSAMFVAVWFIPWQRSSPMILLQRPFATVALYPAAPHSLQHVCGNHLRPFLDSSRRSPTWVLFILMRAYIRKLTAFWVRLLIPKPHSMVMLQMLCNEVV